MSRENALTAEQVDQLVKGIEKSGDVGSGSAYNALKDGPKFTADQQQRLVNTIALSSVVASWALVNIPWLPASQRAYLKAVA